MDSKHAVNKGKEEGEGASASPQRKPMVFKFGSGGAKSRFSSASPASRFGSASPSAASEGGADKASRVSAKAAGKEADEYSSGGLSESDDGGEEPGADEPGGVEASGAMAGAGAYTSPSVPATTFVFDSSPTAMFAPKAAMFAKPGAGGRGDQGRPKTLAERKSASAKKAAAPVAAAQLVDVSRTSHMDYLHNRDVNGQLVAVPVSQGQGSKVFHLSSRDLKFIPQQVFQNPDVTALVLSRNPLGSLPDTLFKLSKLTELNVSKCALESLPEGLGHLTSLTELSVSDNKLRSLPQSIGKLKALTVLRASNCMLLRLPHSMASLIKLETLDLRGNKLQELDPYVVRHWTALTRLDISDNKPDVASSAAEADAYEPILASHCHSQVTSGLSFVGCMVCKSTAKLYKCLVCTEGRLLCEVCLNEPERVAAETLVLGGGVAEATVSDEYLVTGLSFFANVEDELFQRKAAQFDLPTTLDSLVELKELNVSHCGFRSLPAGIGALTALHTLDVRHSRLQTLPAEIGGLCSLLALRVAHCGLAVLPDVFGSFTVMTSLEVQGNHLASLPGSIVALEKLRTLDVSSNQLYSFPAGFAPPAIEVVDVSHNRLRKLSDFEALLAVPALRQFVASHNQIAEFPVSAWLKGTVSVLDLSYNVISDVPAVAGELSPSQEISVRSLSARTLRLDGNLLTRLPRLMTSSLFTVGHNSLTPSMEEHVNTYLINVGRVLRQGGNIELFTPAYIQAERGLQAAVLYEVVQLVIHTIALSPQAAVLSPDHVPLAEFTWSGDDKLDKFMWLMWHLPAELRYMTATAACDAPGFSFGSNTFRMARLHVARVLQSVNETALEFVVCSVFPAYLGRHSYVTLIIVMRKAAIKAALATLFKFAHWLQLTEVHRNRLLQAFIVARNSQLVPLLDTITASSSDAPATVLGLTPFVEVQLPAMRARVQGLIPQIPVYGKNGILPDLEPRSRRSGHG
ncbi:uncharacterized protein AMSG_02350 [Thecamonas trahens ATCC 50062]|uniref:Disease resistance R13L4/SHOC-2-like LRR domain-containing protein n=1 Tax=Thecamonas trahens ATCC 50062 TaxID=461836 RepID=A0A0L0DVY3_THETB|nr:hypothetical protein AMSG_02350 [Thecamonas trahens ATCC 50062]KNC56380.1 hypothetical protein AMSG_02350 [Thecamonas trahens ATCC 50062]|eukprot:XP_013760895.1 hypothetical protein AMSG_02350 [Thecamonas trahens ATCC 50062]